MNRNTVSALIKESNGLGLIKALPNGYEITDDCFINPPQKDTNLSADNPLSVTYALNERCKMIPESVSLAYFVKVLCTQDPIKANKLHSQSFLLT